MTAEEIKAHLAAQFHLPMAQVEEMLPSFLDALEKHLKNLDAAVAETDMKAIGKAGHKLKGACLNLGLQECVEFAVEIEEKGKAGDMETDYGGLVHGLHKLIDPLLR